MKSSAQCSKRGMADHRGIIYGCGCDEVWWCKEGRRNLGQGYNERLINTSNAIGTQEKSRRLNFDRAILIRVNLG